MCSSKQLFSIPEVTEEEDSSQEEHLAQPRPSRPGPRDSDFHHAPLHHPNPHTNYPPPHSRSLTKEPSLTHKQTQVRPKAQHRVHYADTVDTLNFTEEEEDMSFYEGPSSRRVSPRCPPQPKRNSKERVLLRGLGDRLRREAMLRSQMAVTTATNPGYGLTPPRPYPVSRTVRPLKSAIGRGAEIDVEYGTDDNQEPVERSPGEVVVEQTGSQWWAEGAQMEHCTPPHRRALKDDPLVNVAEQLRWLSPPSPPFCPSPCSCGSTPLTQAGAPYSQCSVHKPSHHHVCSKQREQDQAVGKCYCYNTGLHIFTHSETSVLSMSPLK